MQIKINDKKYKAEEGETILDVCQRKKIRIPTLCAHIKLPRQAVCRLCLVEILPSSVETRQCLVSKRGRLVASCTTMVCEGLEVVTESENIKKAREINMELLWSDHAGKCAKCKKNLRCALQSLAEEYKIENFNFVPRREDMTDWEEREVLKDNCRRTVVDEKNPVISRTTEYCVECRRCINICPVKSYGFNNRAGQVAVGTPYNETLDCIFCGACVKHCPTAALTDQNNLKEIEEKLNDLNVLAVAILDPSVMESIRFEFPKINSRKKLVGLLRKLGFERVFDLSCGLNIALDSMKKELKDRKENRVLINSHCAALKLYIERYYPKLKNNLSETMIPDELLARKIKTEYARQEKINPGDIAIISLSSCTAKKAEKYANMDYAMTVRELGRLARGKKINEKKIEESEFDGYFSCGESEGWELMKSGELARKISDGKRSSSRVVSVNNMADIKIILDNIQKGEDTYDFVEAMICPGGCGHGGGQAIKLK